MVPDIQKCGLTDGIEGGMHGRRQNYIKPPSSGDNQLAIFRTHCTLMPNLLNTEPMALKCSTSLKHRLLVYRTSNGTQFFVFKILHEGFFHLENLHAYRFSKTLTRFKFWRRMISMLLL